MNQKEELCSFPISSTVSVPSSAENQFFNQGDQFFRLESYNSSLSKTCSSSGDASDSSLANVPISCQSYCSPASSPVPSNPNRVLTHLVVRPSSDSSPAATPPAPGYADSSPTVSPMLDYPHSSSSATPPASSPSPNIRFSPNSSPLPSDYRIMFFSNNRELTFKDASANQPIPVFI